MQEFEPVKLTEGQEYPLTDTRGLEGIFFSVDKKGTGYMLVCFPHITEAEIEAVSCGPAKVGLFSYDGVAYITANFGNVIEGDAAYHAKLYTGNFVLNEPEPEKGMLLQIHIVDSFNNIFQAGRVCGMGHQWTEKLYSLIDKQKKASLSREEILKKVDEAHARWTAHDLLKLSWIYRIGTRIEEPPEKFVS